MTPMMPHVGDRRFPVSFGLGLVIILQQITLQVRQERPERTSPGHEMFPTLSAEFPWEGINRVS